MAVQYNKLVHTMDKQNISYIELTRRAGFSGNIMTRIRRNEYVSLESIEKICKVLGCKMDDVLEFVADKEGEKENS